MDEQDHLAWVEEIAGTRLGDAKLDGKVDLSDFLNLSKSFGWSASASATADLIIDSLTPNESSLNTFPDPLGEPDIVAVVLNMGFPTVDPFDA